MATKVSKADEALIRSVTRTCRGGLTSAGAEIVQRHLASGDHAAAQRADHANRRPCGQDVNALILAQPLDGLPKEAPCPQCGTVIRWTPPALDPVAT